MSYKQIIFEKSDSIAWVTLNRPEAMNAITLSMLNELKIAITSAGKDNNVGVIVITGAGKAFSSGIDLEILRNVHIENGEIGPIYDLPARELIAEMRSVPKPIIGMINGACITGAMELAINCDLLIAAENAKFGDTHTRWGLRPSWGLSARFPRLIGIMKAKEYSLTGRIFSAREAEQIGLVNRVLPADKLREEVKNYAEEIMKNSREAVATMKYLYNRGMELNLEDSLILEFTKAFAINDSHERLNKFIK